MAFVCPVLVPCKELDFPCLGSCLGLVMLAAPLTYLQP